MKKIIILNICLIITRLAISQDNINVYYQGGSDTYEISENDSLYFNDDETVIYFDIDGTLTNYTIEDIDSLTFDVNTDSIIYITYDESSVSIVNPLSNAGVSVTADGADVEINSEADIKDLTYIISGTTSDGMLKIYSDKRYYLILDGVDITNSDGPAINSQTGKKAYVNLVAGTTNILNDGADYATAPDNEDGEEEDQKATFFSEGELIFNGSGKLKIYCNGSDQHALASDDYIQIDEGEILIKSATKDGLHGKDGVYINGGTLSVSSTGDGIDGDEGGVYITTGTIDIASESDDVKAIKSDTSVVISGGNVNITVSGDQSKGIDSDLGIAISGGSIGIETSGGVVLEESNMGYDPSYCSAIKCDSDIDISGGDITITCSGIANRGISSNANLNIEGGNIKIEASGDGATYTNSDGETDSYHSSCISIDTDFSFTGDTLILSNSGSGGKGISADNNFVMGDDNSNPVLDITTTGSDITVSNPGGGRGDEGTGEYDEGKALKSDNSVTINSGVLNISSVDDGIKAGSSITFNGGSITISDSYEAVESPKITVNDGYLSLYSEDDGFNATYGNGGESDDGSLLKVTGGYIYAKAEDGDALDSNGDILISGGTSVIHGAESSVEVGLDVNGDCQITGGFIVVSGPNSNQTEGASSNSTQYALLLKSNSTFSTGTLIHIEDADGNDILTFAPENSYASIVFSSSDLTKDETYYVYSGGSYSKGTEEDGLYTGGTYTGGTQKTSFTISSTITEKTF